MSTFKSITDIVNSKEFKESRSQAQKYVKHEFQDYALRLAHDLGDLHHKLIYLRLAKQVPKPLLEQAAAFALGYYNEPNKGKLFMARLKQIRDEEKLKQDIQNTDPLFVINRMAEMQNELCEGIAVKMAKQFIPERITRLHKFAQYAVANFKPARKNNNPTVIDYGCGNGLDAEQLTKFGLQVKGIDPSHKLVSKAKAKFAKPGDVKKASIISPNLPTHKFNAIWCSRWWRYLPIAGEDKLIVKMAELLAPQGVVYLETAVANQEQQGWERFNAGNREFLHWHKSNQEVGLLAKWQNMGFSLLDKVEVDSADAKHTVVGYFLQL